MLNPFFDKYIFTGGLKYQHNNFFLMGIPFSIVPLHLLINENLAEDVAFNKKLYYSVKAGMIKSITTAFGVDFKVEGDAGLFLLENFLTASGWGLVTQSDLDKKNSRAIIVVNNSPVGALLFSKVKSPSDHLLRGVFAGIFTVYFGKKVDCVETECNAINSQRCDFIIKENHEFDFSNALVRNQIDVQD